MNEQQKVPEQVLTPRPVSKARKTPKRVNLGQARIGVLCGSSTSFYRNQCWFCGGMAGGKQ